MIDESSREHGRGAGCAAGAIHETLMSAAPDPILQSVLTCPACGAKSDEVMPVDACIFFHECRSCRALLRPLPGQCCVFCSFGSVPCPPVQYGSTCCASSREPASR